MATVTKPILLDSTGQEILVALKDIKTAIASGKAPEATTWRDVQANVRNGLAGDLYPANTKFAVFKCASAASKGAYLKYYLDVVGHDKHFLLRHGSKTADHSMSVQVHELFNETLQFDAAEDQYGLSMDEAVVAWKTYYSDTAGTVVSSPSGSPKDNGYYERNDTSQYPRSQHGSNNWRHSALRKWLNANRNVAAGSWWSKTTPFDKAPSYSSYLPFQAMLADDSQGADCTLLDVVGPVTIRTTLNNIKNPDNADYYLDADASGQYSVASRLSYDVTEDTFFLPSTKEIHCSTYNEDGGVLLDYYERFSDYADPISAWDVSDTNLIKHYKNSSSSAWWWLRSPIVGHAYDVFRADGQVDSGSAVYGHGVAPLCVIY